MTRGTLAAICASYDGKDKLLTSMEFNGDMYPSHYGKTAVVMLKKVNSIPSFISCVARFNEKAHKYEDEKQVFSQPVETIDFTKNYYENWFSDYVYIKNASQNTYIIRDKNNKCFEFEPGAVVRLNFGEVEKIFR